MDLARLAVPTCTRAAIHLIGRVVSLRSRAALASLRGSLRRRVAHSDSGQPRCRAASRASPGRSAAAARLRP